MPRDSARPTSPWPWPLAAAAASALAVIRPETALVVLAVALVVAAVVAPRTTVGLTVLVVLFVRPVEHLVPVPELGYLDEALVVLCAVVLPLRRLLADRSLRTIPGQWWFVAFALLGVVSGVVRQVPPGTFVTGAFVVCKGLVFAWAVSQVDWEERHLRVAARTGAVLVVACLAATGANLAVPDAWNAVLASDPNAVDSRWALPSLIGPFTHPLDLGQFMALATIAVATWRTAVRRTAGTALLMVATAAATLASARRTAIGGLVVGWSWITGVARSTGALLALVVCAPVLAIVLAAPLADVVRTTYVDYLAPDADPAARTVLTLDSIDVAAQSFPTGAGFGRFGSAVAAATYSPEYVARDYPEIWGLGRSAEEGRFLTDTEWPAILGETGFLGAVAFAVGLLAIYRAGRRLWASERAPELRWAGLLLVGWLVACLVQSVATVTFTGPPVFGAFFGLVGVVTAVSEARPDRQDGGQEDGGQEDRA